MTVGSAAVHRGGAHRPTQELRLLLRTGSGGRTLKWLKVKQSRFRVGERGWEPKRG